MDTQSMMNVRMTANATGRDCLETWKKVIRKSHVPDGPAELGLSVGCGVTIPSLRPLSSSSASIPAAIIRNHYLFKHTQYTHLASACVPLSSRTTTVKSRLKFSLGNTTPPSHLSPTQTQPPANVDVPTQDGSKLPRHSSDVQQTQRIK